MAIIDFEKILKDAKILASAEDVDTDGEEAAAESSRENDIFDVLYQGDNLGFMKALAYRYGMAGGIQMIYIDPPFFTGGKYSARKTDGATGDVSRVEAYGDRWEGGIEEYLTELSARLMLMRTLLSDTGLIFLHLDWHASHYARILMDEIFGSKRFLNEIIWTYKSGGSTSKRFARKHDNILLYSKTARYKFHPIREKSYNRGLKPYRFQGVEEFCDDIGWYTMVNMKDVWQLDMVGRTSAERTGYATQKPEKLIERMIESSTDQGDLVADFFCGSGTLPVAAAKLGRKFIACDLGDFAIECTRKRLQEAGASYEFR